MPILSYLQFLDQFAVEVSCSTWPTIAEADVNFKRLEQHLQDYQVRNFNDLVSIINHRASDTPVPVICDVIKQNESELDLLYWKSCQNWTYGSRDITILLIVLLKTIKYKGNWRLQFAHAALLVLVREFPNIAYFPKNNLPMVKKQNGRRPQSPFYCSTLHYVPVVVLPHRQLGPPFTWFVISFMHHLHIENIWDV